MMRVWGRANSANVMKVLWLLDEAGIAYERIDAGGVFGRTGTPEYRAMNPPGLIPTIEDDGFSMFESNAIIRYIASAHQQAAAFYPGGPREHAEIDAWMDLQQTVLNRPQAVVFQGLVRTPAERRDHTAIAAAVSEAGAAWAMLDSKLAGRDFIFGAQPTIADIAFGVHVHRWLNMPIARSDATHLHAWYNRLLTRPPFAQHVAQPLT